MPADIGHDLVSYYEKVPAVEIAVFCKCGMTIPRSSFQQHYNMIGLSVLKSKDKLIVEVASNKVPEIVIYRGYTGWTKTKLTKLTNWTNKLTMVISRICNIALQPFWTLLPVEVCSCHINPITNISCYLSRLVVHLDNASSPAFVSHLWLELILL
jgi:hypothetical protein